MSHWTTSRRPKRRAGNTSVARLLADIRLGSFGNRQLLFERGHAGIERIRLPDQITDAIVAGVIGMHTHP